MKKYFIWIGIFIIALSSCNKETEQEINDAIITESETQEEETIVIDINSLPCPQCFKDIIHTININPGCVTGSLLEEYEYQDELYYKIIIDETLCTLNDHTLGNKFLHEDCSIQKYALADCPVDFGLQHFYSNIEFKQIIWEKN